MNKYNTKQYPRCDRCNRPLRFKYEMLMGTCDRCSEEIARREALSSKRSKPNVPGN